MKGFAGYFAEKGLEEECGGIFVMRFANPVFCR